MNFVWFLAGILGGIIVYHNLVPWIVQRSGQSREVLRQIVRGLNHDAFLNLEWAVGEERRRRGMNDSQAN